jgi:tRNA pseudouridine38-40 synthase
MHCIKLTLAYDGTAYAGWQIQPDRSTVQGVLEAAIERITGQAARTLASGRTDAGVHALGQVVSFRTDCKLAPDVLVRALNAKLPRDIAVLDAARADDDFHPIRDAKRKRYRYAIHDGPVRDVFNRHYAWQFKCPLDAETMHRAAGALLGRHDFSSYENAGAPRQDSIRTVTDIQVSRLPAACGFATSSQSASQGGAEQSRAGRGGQNHIINIEVEADGFLYNMVRAIVGTLVEVGRGAQAESWPAQALAATDRGKAGPTAPPQGLFLLNVDYE